MRWLRTLGSRPNAQRLFFLASVLLSVELWATFIIGGTVSFVVNLLVLNFFIAGVVCVKRRETGKIPAENKSRRRFP